MASTSFRITSTPTCEEPAEAAEKSATGKEVKTLLRGPLLIDAEKTINQYSIIKTIGRGTFSKVKKCIIPAGTDGMAEEAVFALKMYRKSDLRNKRDFRADTNTGNVRVHTHLEQVYHEIEILSHLDHPHCLHCHEVIESDDPAGRLCIVLDYMACGAIMSHSNGAYKSKMAGDTTFDEEVAKCILKDVCTGLTYLHNVQKVAHRDIKPDNLLMDEKGRIKIGDYSSAEYVDSNGHVKHTKGTYYFMSPECLELPSEGAPYVGHNGRAADMWGLGVTLWAMLFGNLHVSGHSYQELFDSILNWKFYLPENRELSAEGKDFLQNLLCSDPESRLSAEAALKHPWISSADYSNVERCAAALLKEKEELQHAADETKK